MEWQTLKEEIDNWLENYLCIKDAYNKKLFEAMAYSVNIGGKRIRPILLILTFRLFKKNYKEILPIACSLEMIHTYSLIHDDLPCMDNDDLRRGKPTNHKVFGDATAVLAGDALLNEAFNIMFKCCLNGDINKIKACSEISNSAGAEGMIGGQVVDIINEGKQISKEELDYIHTKKTSELIKAAVKAGAILGGASEEEIRILGKYGKNLGLAFQIKDDILDVTGSTEKLGKMIKSDEENNKVTYVTLYGLDYCYRKCEELINECFKLLSKINKDTSLIASLTNFLLKRDY